MTTRLLIVEDDPELQELYGVMLDGEPYEIDVACDGGEALGMLQSRMPDVILLDILLGDVSGDRFFRAVKQDPRYEGIPIIIATVLPRDACQDLLAMSSDTQLLRKPFSKAVLTAALSLCLQPNAPGSDQADRLPAGSVPGGAAQ